MIFVILFGVSGCPDPDVSMEPSDGSCDGGRNFVDGGVMTVLPPRAPVHGLIGRGPEIDRARSALTGGFGVALVGHAGVGRTSVAREVVTRLDARRACVVWLTATEAGRQVPFGALAALMPASSAAEVTAVVPAVRQALRERAGGRRLVLVVDDAHLLDGPSAAVVLGLAGQVGLVVTACAGVAQPDAVTALWKDGYLDRVALGPFGESDTARLVAALVRGEVAAPTAELVHQWTRGNALYLTELVRAGLADGTLGERAGLWWWQAPLRVPPTLADLFDRQLDLLDGAARDGLGAVALGEPLPLEVLERIVAPDVVVQLEDVGLLRADAAVGGPAGRLVLRLPHPMLGAAVRRRLSPARRRRLSAALLTAWPGGPSHPAEAVAMARWQLDAGGPIDDSRLLEAAELVLHSDPALSLTLTEEVARHRPSTRAHLAHADALAESGRLDEARAVLEKAAADVSDTADDVPVTIALAGHRAWAERDPAGGHDALMLLLQRTGDASARAEIRSVDALVQLFGGRTREALAAAESVLADDAAEPSAQVRARLARAAGLSLVGRTADALEAAAQAAGDSAGLPYAHGMALAATALAQIWRSPVPDVPRTHPHTGRWPTFPGHEATAWPLFDGYARRVAGDLPGAIGCLRAAVVQQSGGEGLFRSEAAAWLTLCLAEAGRVGEAEEVLRSTPPDAVAVVPGLLSWASAGVAAAHGDRRRAIDLMAEAGEAARRSGCRLVELGYLIYEAGLHGSQAPGEVAERLRATVEHVDAPRLVAIARATLDVAAAPHPAALTAREHQIAVLAADRLTDREIAEQLVLSVRTVESHLARVYRKLTVTSRRQLKAALHR